MLVQQSLAKPEIAYPCSVAAFSNTVILFYNQNVDFYRLGDDSFSEVKRLRLNFPVKQSSVSFLNEIETVSLKNKMFVILNTNKRRNKLFCHIIDSELNVFAFKANDLAIEFVKLKVLGNGFFAVTDGLTRWEVYYASETNPNFLDPLATIIFPVGPVSMTNDIFLTGNLLTISLLTNDSVQLYVKAFAFDNIQKILDCPAELRKIDLSEFTQQKSLLFQSNFPVFHDLKLINGYVITRKGHFVHFLHLATQKTIEFDVSEPVGYFDRETSVIALFSSKGYTNCFTDESGNVQRDEECNDFGRAVPNRSERIVSVLRLDSDTFVCFTTAGAFSLRNWTPRRLFEFAPLVSKVCTF